MTTDSDVRDGLPYPADVEGADPIGHGIYVLWMREQFEMLWHHPKCRAWARVLFGEGHHYCESMTPLTIRGSLLCPMGCGTHGFITNGRWVPA